MKAIIAREYGRMFRLGLAVAMLAGAMIGCGTSGGGGGVKSATHGGVVDASGKRAVVKEEAVATFESAAKIAYSDPNAAIEGFRKAANEEDNFAEAEYNIGVLEQKRGNTAEALKAYDKAIEMRPNMEAAYVSKAKILIDQGKTEEAENLLNTVVGEGGLNAFNVEGNLNLSMIYRQRGEALLEKARGGSEPKFNMGGVDEEEGAKDKDKKKKSAADEQKDALKAEAQQMFAKAVVYIRRALAGDSNNIYCYENLAAIYYLQNSLEVARLVIDQAKAKFDEYNGNLKTQLDEGRITQEEYDIKAYTLKDLSAIYNTSGLIYLAEGEVSMGNSEFKTAVDKDPTNVQAMLNVAGIAVNVQDYQLAYDLYTKVLELQPNNVEAYLSKGVAARGLQRLDEAEAIYRDIIARYPDYPQAQFNLIVLIQEYYLKVDEARAMWVEFVANEKANAIIPGRVEEAKDRIKQIDDMKEQMRKAEEEAARIQKQMEEMERLEREMEAAEKAANGGE